jgi:hypothetical protein
VAYFFLDKKVGKKSRPDRNLSACPPVAGPASDIPEKNIFRRNFFGCSESTNFRMAELKKKIINNSWLKKFYATTRTISNCFSFVIDKVICYLALIIPQNPYESQSID